MQCKTTSTEQSVIVDVLTSQPDKATSQLFCRPRRIPNEDCFHISFYRLLDSNDLAEEDKRKLGEVEESIFKSEVGLLFSV